MTDNHDTNPTAELAPGRPDTLHVCVDTTPGAHATGSDDIYWWLPIIGPTAAVLAQSLARTTRAGGTSWDTADLARRIGLAGNQSKLWQSLNRLDRFGVAHFHATDVLTVRLWLPALSAAQVDRLPDDMATTYRNTQRLAG